MSEMKKIKYIFLTVTIALVTVFYIINIQGKDQQIISERLPKADLIANNENQNPETIPSPQEVVKEIDD
ncbi:hypothetical protein NE652_12305, partial [Bifidobacterium pseudocatenulatum]|nr:hypothetical protein [Bifidobacterium pseudocatenulatum]